MKKSIVFLAPIVGLIALPVASYADGHATPYVCATGATVINDPVLIGAVTGETDGVDGPAASDTTATAFAFQFSCATDDADGVASAMDDPAPVPKASLAAVTAALTPALDSQEQTETVAFKACGPSSAMDQN